MFIELQKLSFYYGKFCALQDVSFSCQKGEIVGLIGSNGAGKSTTIKNLVRYLRPSSGNILIDGRDIFSFNQDYPVSYIPDMPIFFDELSVLEHLQFMKAIYPQNPLRIDTLLEQMELHPHQNKLPFALSKGTKQKLMISIALLKDYDILVADEPFTGLDPTQIAQLKYIFFKQKQDHKTVILSSHLLDVVENICDRFVIIQGGKLKAVGTRDDLMRKTGLDPVQNTLEDAYLKLVDINE